MKYDLRRAIRFNLAVTWFFVLLFTTTAFINGGSEYGMKALVATSAAGILATVVYFLPLKDIVKGVTLVCIPTIGAYGLSIANHGVDRMFNVYILGLVMVALYFRFKAMIAYGGFWSIFTIVLYMVSPVSLLGQEHATFGEFVPRMGSYLSVFLVLVFLTKWGNDLLEQSTLETERSKEALNQLDSLFSGIHETVDHLSLQVDECNDRMGQSAESSKGISSSMREVSRSVESSAEKISNISKAAQHSRVDVQKTSEIMEEIENQFKSVISDVEQSETAIDQMGVQVGKIKESVDSSHATVSDLSERMQEITALLQGITNISDQTNLLALNASIEAARAGEHGKGFAVVAEEIRKLSEESNRLANGIREITQRLSVSTDKAKNDVEAGQLAMNEGNSSMAELHERFEHMKNSFRQVSQQIDLEYGLVRSVSDQFRIIDMEITEIAAFMEEYSATSEEVSAQTEMQLALSEEVLESMKQIVDSGHALKKMAER